ESVKGLEVDVTRRRNPHFEMRLLVMSALALSALGACVGDSDLEQTTTSDLTLELNVIRSRHGLPAVFGAIVDTQGLQEAAVAGVRRSDETTLATIDDKFSVASCGKAMTATVVAILVEQGLLNWDDRVSEIFPELAGSMDRAYADMTVTHLLAHSGGLDDDILVPRLQSELPTRLSVVEQRLWIVEQALRTPTGTVGSYEYSTVGYVVAGAIIEKVTGQPWETVMTRRLFEPLGMTSTGYDPPPADQPGWIWWHEWTNGRAVPVPLAPDPVMTVGRPSGGVHLSMADWARFASAHLRGDRGESSIVSAETFRRLHTAASSGESYDLGYALGWHVLSINGRRVLAHGGAGSLRAAIQLWPDQSRALLVMTNCGDPAGRQGMDASIQLLQRRVGL
ncbi:MAG: beta-lactamase family protein, partial [Vicinamibacteria bacterium]|nr:beta-lactamase family protein [Vicinamibacteria bacterium]